MKISTQNILKIVAVSGLVVSAGVMPAIPIAVSIICKQLKYANRIDVGKIVKRLERQRMIRMTEIDGTVRIEVTDKGQRRLLQYDYEQLERKVTRRDGLWRLIIFDIPEKNKQSRNAFIRKLLQLDCIRCRTAFTRVRTHVKRRSISCVIF